MVGHDVDDRDRAADRQASTMPPMSITIHAGPAPLQLQLGHGEIVGLGGLVGSGRTRLARRLGGLEEGVAVEYRIGESRFTVRSAAQAIARGIVYLTEDRKRDGLFGALSVLRNTSAASLGRLTRRGFIDRREELRCVGPALARLRLVAASLRTSVRSLSGGNQQKVLFARALLARPVLLICDEPTRGVDVGAREEIYKLIDSLSREGVSVVLVSSELKELLSLCHRILVVRDATVVAELPPTASEVDIVGAAVGPSS
jgi:ABC-type sugar transport system ATPase subunit